MTIGGKYLEDWFPNIHLTDVSDWDREKWLGYRTKGIGCSEVGSVLNLNPYNSPAQVFHEKLGTIETEEVRNMAILMGNQLEDTVMNLWKHYEEGVKDSIVENMNDGVIIREAIKPNVYARNPKYPWLFGGCDGIFEHNGEMAILEIKTISSRTCDKYENGVPPYYICQVQAYMMLFDCNYAELCMLVDGRDFKVVPFHRDEEFVTIINDKCSKFVDSIKACQSNESLITDLEPQPEGDDAYKAFLKKRWSGSDQSVMQPSEELSDLCVEYFKAKAIMDEATEGVNKVKHQMQNMMGNHTEIDFPKDTYSVTWRKNKRGARTFLIKEK